MFGYVSEIQERFQSCHVPVSRSKHFVVSLKKPHTDPYYQHNKRENNIIVILQYTSISKFVHYPSQGACVVPLVITYIKQFKTEDNTSFIDDQNSHQVVIDKWMTMKIFHLCKFHYGKNPVRGNENVPSYRREPDISIQKQAYLTYVFLAYHIVSFLP